MGSFLRIIILHDIYICCVVKCGTQRVILIFEQYSLHFLGLSSGICVYLPGTLHFIFSLFAFYSPFYNLIIYITYVSAVVRIWCVRNEVDSRGVALASRTLGWSSSRHNTHTPTLSAVGMCECMWCFIWS